MWEIIIDITKHAVLGKFNDIRPGIYREYMRDLCSDSLDKHSHNLHKLVGFCPLGPAALALRTMHTLFTLKADGHPSWRFRTAVILAVWLSACVFQVMLGFSMKWLAYLYVQHHTAQAGGKTLPRAINVTPAGTKIAPVAATAAAPAAAGPPGGASKAGTAVGVGSSSVGNGMSSAPGATTAGSGVQHSMHSPRNNTAPAAAPAAAAAAAPAAVGPLGSPLLESKSVTEAVIPASPLSMKQAAQSDEASYTATSSSAGGSNSDPGDNRTSTSSSSSSDTLPAAAVGFSSSYAAPSAAGMTMRVYTRSPSCADFPMLGVKQVAVEQH